MQDNNTSVAREENGAHNKRHWSSIGYVLIAFACAISLWFYVADYDRIIEKEIQNVPVELVLPTNESLSVESGLGNYVNIRVSGRKADVIDMTADDLRAYIDTTGVNEETNRAFDVQVEVLRKGVSVVDSRNIPQVTVVLVESVVKDFPVEPVIKHLIDTPNYIETSCVPGTIKITGSASIINSIVTAEVREDVGKIEGDSSVWGNVVLKDAKGNVVPQTYLDLDTTDVKVYIDVFTKKELDVEVQFTGGVYDVATSGAKIQCNPSKVMVVGPLKSLEPHDRVVLELDEKLIEDSDYTCTLELPTLSDYVNMEYEGGITEVEVSITENLITKTEMEINNEMVVFDALDDFNVDIIALKVDDGEYQETTQIVIRGDRESISKLTEQKVDVTFDLEKAIEDYKNDLIDNSEIVRITDIPATITYSNLGGVFTKNKVFVTIEVSYNSTEDSGEDISDEYSLSQEDTEVN